MFQELEGKNVIVRSSESGVWLGVLAKVQADSSGATVQLTDARRVWSWEGAGSCSGLATHGPSSGKVEGAVATAVVLGVCEVLSCTDAAVVAFAAIEAWRP